MVSKDICSDSCSSVSLRESKYFKEFDSLTVMVLEAIYAFCKTGHVDKEKVEKKLRRYVLYKDYTGFSNFFVRYSKDSLSMKMVEVYNTLSQEAKEELFISLSDAFKNVPKEMIFG